MPRYLRPVLQLVTDERTSQDLTHGWPHTHSRDRWLTILAEEVGEVAKAIQDEPDVRQIQELVQVAAVAVAMAEELFEHDPYLEEYFFGS